jgi:DNA polymerase-3 subunit alpha
MHIEKIRDLCLDNEMPALGLTDNNLFGALEFSEKLANSGIQPIIGTTLNIYDKDQNTGVKLSNYSTICLISNSLHGYKNLLKLSSSAYQKQNSLLPFVTMQEVFELNQGLFFLTGGIKGIVNQSLRANNKDLAVSQLKSINKNFQGRLFIELQRHDHNEANIENNLIDIAYDMNLPIVATNDVFFPSKEDHGANDILQCIPSSDVLSNPNRKKFHQSVFLKIKKI